MSVYDNELIINGEAVRSPEQQVYKNMKDIKSLKETIKPEYNCSVTLTSSSVSVAIASTNAPEGTTEGWILTQDGLKFKITGGDDTNLLIEYYADLKGPQGPDGAALNIDDTTESLTKVWSSKKTADTIKNIINDTPDSYSDDQTFSQEKIMSMISNGNYYTLVEPVSLGDGDYQLDTVYCGEYTIEPSGSDSNNTLKYGDVIFYVDSTLKIASAYYYTSTVEGNLVAKKIADIGGKQLYQHNFYILSSECRLTFTIICDTENAMTSAQASEFLYNASLRENRKCTIGVGWHQNQNDNTWTDLIAGVYSANGTSLSVSWFRGGVELYSGVGTITTFLDNVYPI